jgi:hypothetical protein
MVRIAEAESARRHEARSAIFAFLLLLTNPFLAQTAANPLFHLKPVPPLSDLLLHDVGTGDSIGRGTKRFAGTPGRRKA